jgi:hypothetical protein
MTTYLLYIFYDFENHDEVEFLTTEVLAVNPVVSSLRYVIENKDSIIVIFDSDRVLKQIAEELFGALSPLDMNFYFLFNREDLITASLPMDIKDKIFKPAIRLTNEEEEEDLLKDRVKELDIDVILEKVHREGVSGLTAEEKRFLDGYNI